MNSNNSPAVDGDWKAAGEDGKAAIAVEVFGKPTGETVEAFLWWWQQLRLCADDDGIQEEG